jgi:tetratricopeptide (TPR) repeat protein
MKKNEQAKKMIDRQVLALRAARDTTVRYGYSLNLKAAIYYGDKEYAVAEATWLEALELCEQTQDSNSPEKITILNNLGTLYHDTGQYEKGLSARRKQIKMAQRLLGKAHPDSFIAGINFAHLLSETGEVARSVRMLESQRKLFEAYDFTQTNLYLRHLRLIGMNSRDMGNYKLSEDSFKTALTISISPHLNDPDDIGRLMGGLAKTLEAAGKLEDSMKVYKQALDHYLEHRGTDDWYTNRERLNLARLLHKLGRNTEAIELLRELQASMGRNDEPDDDDRQLISDSGELMQTIQEAAR